MDKDTAAFGRFLKKVIAPRHRSGQAATDKDDPRLEELAQRVRAKKRSLRKTAKAAKGSTTESISSEQFILHNGKRYDS
ncbi:hypothetical protein [Noviherbaspirillum pedocola]|uniref:Uncharacterized protein n=1 Tax=Noviherbaspirillum pedocola TaxID=2801341 RepID=A0A934SR64_9BURK|nr:hypothetical protein [Noviherbaspirillum pedocola]MBK4735241.1 hypothetical protein [Noviherbaspirillum pedocola]